MFDAPPTIGHNLQRAMDEVAATEGVGEHGDPPRLLAPSRRPRRRGKPVRRRRRSHRVTPRRGGCCCGTTTRRGLRPELTFEDDAARLEVGGERRSSWPSTAPTTRPDNIYIHFPGHDALMLIDIVNPGWVPIYNLNLSEDVPGYLERSRRGSWPTRGSTTSAGTWADWAPATTSIPAPAVHRRHRRQRARRTRLGRPRPRTSASTGPTSGPR